MRAGESLGRGALELRGMGASGKKSHGNWALQLASRLPRPQAPRHPYSQAPLLNSTITHEMRRKGSCR